MCKKQKEKGKNCPIFNNFAIKRHSKDKIGEKMRIFWTRRRQTPPPFFSKVEKLKSAKKREK